MTCLHADKRLVIDLKHETYWIQCRACSLTGEQARSGVAALRLWMRMLRLMRTAAA